MTDFDIRERDFHQILNPGAQLREIATGFQFTEGPVWLARRRVLVFSDIDGDTLHQWSPADGVKVFRRPSGKANGNTLDRQGRLITCEHGNRRVSLTQPTGEVVTLVDSHNGRRLNSPNDVVVKSDGTIWFTDPPYGIKPEQQEQPACFLFRYDPHQDMTGPDPMTPAAKTEPRLVALRDDFPRPNGLCFSPDERRLYVADSSMERHHVRVFDVTRNELSGGEVFCEIAPGVPDGMRVDLAGRLFTTAGDGVWVLAPNGRLLGKILVPQTPANCAFGGEGGRTLFITARHSVYAIELATSGA